MDTVVFQIILVLYAFVSMGAEMQNTEYFVTRNFDNSAAHLHGSSRK
jgi:hypothetical protein